MQGAGDEPLEVCLGTRRRPTERLTAATPGEPNIHPRRPHNAPAMLPDGGSRDQSPRATTECPSSSADSSAAVAAAAASASAAGIIDTPGPM